MVFFSTYENDIIKQEFEVDESMKDTGFRKFIIQENGQTPSTIHMMKNSLATTIKKPQRCIMDHPDFYVGIDLYTNTYYICYRDLLMVDLDESDEGKMNTLVDGYLNKHPGCVIDIYKTRKGYHLFLLDRPRDYKDDTSLQTMLDLGCDFYYTIYTALRGWSVRLNRKQNERIACPLYEYVGRRGCGGAVDKRLEGLVNIHIKLCEQFLLENPSLMK